MHMKSTKIFIIVVIVIISFWSLNFVNNHTVKLDGVIRENGQEENAEIIYCNTKSNKLFNHMNGFIEVNTEEDSFRYEFKKRHLFKNQDFYFIVVDRIYGTNDYEHGYAFFDDKIKNIVVITDERSILAANEQFVKKVEACY